MIRNHGYSNSVDSIKYIVQVSGTLSQELILKSKNNIKKLFENHASIAEKGNKRSGLV